MPTNAKHTWYIGVNPRTGSKARKTNVKPVGDIKPTSEENLKRSYIRRLPRNTAEQRTRTKSETHTDIQPARLKGKTREGMAEPSIYVDRELAYKVRNASKPSKRKNSRGPRILGADGKEMYVVGSNRKAGGQARKINYDYNIQIQALLGLSPQEGIITNPLNRCT